MFKHDWHMAQNVAQGRKMSHKDKKQFDLISNSMFSSPILLILQGSFIYMKFHSE